MEWSGRITFRTCIQAFRKLMGTGCMLKWREWKGIGERERIWGVDPAHPIANGIPEYIELEHSEMYGEHFDIPQPDQLVFICGIKGEKYFVVDVAGTVV
jgi:trehalose utilization protein